MLADRTPTEKIFILLYIPFVLLFYSIYKYPTFFVSPDQVEQYFYFFGKSTSFWYSTVYTLFICVICVQILWKDRSPYSSDSSVRLSTYQKWKWRSILASQFILFYFVPYYLPYILSGDAFFGDTYAPVNKNAYVYVYNGFTSVGGFIYIFLVVPLSVWFFGKRYCSWFCACGNLAEAAGTTPFGARWVRKFTPRGKTAEKLEVIQFIFLILALCFGLLLFFDMWNVFSASSLIESWRSFQDFVVDFIFGALIGVGAYPFLGTRIWCRYGCPLAQLMKLFGRFSRSRFKVQANNKCKGLNLCTTVCPMGIDVASYAHKNKVPLKGSFSLTDSPCIGCGGCVDICPVKALSFEKILNPEKNNEVAV